MKFEDRPLISGVFLFFKVLKVSSTSLGVIGLENLKTGESGLISFFLGRFKEGGILLAKLVANDA